MKNTTKETFDRATLDASLQRLGVRELDERLEFAPLLVEAGLQDDTTDMQFECCSCKLLDPDHYRPYVPQIANPWGGDGSTGPTSGELHW